MTIQSQDQFIYIDDNPMSRTVYKNWLSGFVYSLLATCIYILLAIWFSVYLVLCIHIADYLVLYIAGSLVLWIHSSLPCCIDVCFARCQVLYTRVTGYSGFIYTYMHIGGYLVLCYLNQCIHCWQSGSMYTSCWLFRYSAYTLVAGY